MFKKLMYTACLLSSISLTASVLTEKDITVTIKNFEYSYSSVEKNCIHLEDQYSFILYKKYKDGSLIIDGQIAKWEDGATFINAVATFPNDEKVYPYNLFTDLAMCEAYKELIKVPNKK